MQHKKSAFNFYRNYHDLMPMMNDAQLGSFVRAISDVMFFDKHIDDVTFKDPTLSLAWAAIKYQMRASVDGYASKLNTSYDEIVPPCQPPMQPPAIQEKEQGEEKGEGQEQGKEKPSRKVAKKAPITAETWQAYKIAYSNRYQVEPTRNATVNGQLANFVKRIGAEDSPSVAAFFLQNNSAWYINKAHSVASMLADAEKLHTEWKRGSAITTAGARQIDRTQNNLQAWQQVEVK